MRSWTQIEIAPPLSIHHRCEISTEWSARQEMGDEGVLGAIDGGDREIDRHGHCIIGGESIAIARTAECPAQVATDESDNHRRAPGS